MYLWRRPTGFYFQLLVPKKIRVYLGSTPLRVWLGAIEKREARRVATFLAAEAFRNMGAGMTRKALDASLKALQEEMDSISKNKKMATRQANRLRNQLDMEFNFELEEEVPLWRWKLDKHDLDRVEEASKFDGIADAYTTSLEQLSRIHDALKLGTRNNPLF